MRSTHTPARSSLVAVAAALAATLAACGQGSFTVSFTWADEAPADTSALFLSAVLQHWPDGEAARAVSLATAGPIRGGGDEELRFTDLGYGGDRVVLAEVRGSADPRERVLYRGRSELFDLRAGRETKVTVSLKLAPTPGTNADVDGVVRIERDGVAVSTVNTALVDLSLPVAGATRVRVANDPAFSAGVTERTTERLDAAVTAGHGLWSDWDLNAGLPTSVTTLDGQRTVFVLLFDELGYPSPVLRASVTLDTTPPVATLATVTYESGPGTICPLRSDELHAAQPGTLVTVTFTVSEPLGANPVVFVGDPLSFNLRTLPLDLAASTDNYWVARKAINVTNEWLLETGSHPIKVQLSDLAGNTNAPDGQVLPADPLVVRELFANLQVDQAALTYWRAPYGLRDREAAYFELGVAAAPMPRVNPDGSRPDTVGVLPLSTFTLGGTPPVAVGVYVAEPPELDGAPYQPGAELGVLRVAENGLWPVSILRQVDTPQIMVIGYDDACNGGIGVLIEQNAWIASPRARAGQLRQTLVALADADAPPLTADSQLVSTFPPTDADSALLDGNPVRATTGPRWRPLPEGGLWPAARRGHELVYDSRRGRLVLAGGVFATGSLAFDLHEWDGTAWTKVSGGVMPDPWYAGIESRFPAYLDQRAGVVMLLPGWQVWGGAVLDTLSLPGLDGPSTPVSAAAYDPQRGLAIMLEVNETSATTWTWDGSEWRSYAAPVPHPRDGAALVYDESSGMVMLFGGHGESRATLFGTTWGFDGAAWQVLTDEAHGPGARSGHALTYDRLGQRVLLFGGCTTYGTFSCTELRNDTWVWDGASWTELPPAPEPAPRRFHALAFDTNRGLAYLFGGQGDGGAVFGDLWSFDGSRWRQQPTDLRVSAAGLDNPSIALGHDPVLGQDLAVLWSVFSAELRTLLGTKTGWQLVETGPPPHWGPLVYDPASEGLLLVSATDWTFTRATTTWAWNGSSWVDTGETLPPLAAFGAAADPTGVLLFGGRSADTVTSTGAWRWDGAGWSAVTFTGAQPTPRWDPLMATDGLGRTWLHGGGAGSPYAPQYFEDTWRWDGATWTELTPPGVPTTPQECAGFGVDQPIMCNYSAALVPLGAEGMLLVGPTQVWVWSGSAWARLPAAIGGEPLVTGYDDFAVAASALGTEIAMLAIDSDHAYAWDFPPERAPAIRWVVDFSGAAIDARTIDGLELSFAGQATFHPYGSTDTEAVLQAWATGGESAGSWATLSTDLEICDASQSRVCSVWRATDPAEAKSFVATHVGQIVGQVRPLGGSGAAGGAASVLVDALEARVRYRVLDGAGP